MPPPPPSIASLPPSDQTLPSQIPPAPGVVLTPPDGVTDRIPIGLLLPLSGRSAALGRSLLDAAQLALFEVAGEKFELLPRDTMGTPEGARAAAESVLDSGARLLLGPVFAASARETAPVAQLRGVTQIAFTNDRTAAGDGAFVIGFLPGQRIRRVVSYAASKGVRRFAALIPQGYFGDLVGADYQQAVAQVGGELVRVARYAPTTESAIDAVKRLGDYDARKAALSARRNALKAAGDPASLRALKFLENRETLGDVPFDAVLLPESGQALTAVAPLLPYYEIDTRKVRVLGIDDWSPRALRREAAIAGAWYVGPDPGAHDAFSQRFAKIYGAGPHPLASLAYDATALAAVLAESGDGSLGPDRLTVANGFAGSTGLFRFSPDGLVEHRFSVMEVQPDAVRVVAPAPQAFGEIVGSAPAAAPQIEAPPMVESPPVPASSIPSPSPPASSPPASSRPAPAPSPALSAPTFEPLPPPN